MNIPTHYAIICDEVNPIVHRYRLFGFTSDPADPNEAIFSTDSEVQFKIRLALLGLKCVHIDKGSEIRFTTAYYC